MFELTLLTCIVVVVVLAIRRGQPVVLEHPLIVDRVGKYHATLAPQLNQAQTLVAKIHACFAASGESTPDAMSSFWQVTDASINAGQPYLLAIAGRGGKLYFQAILPTPLLRDQDSHLHTIQAFSEQVLAELPPAKHNEAAPRIQQALQSAANELSIHITALE